jgi:hypothetical protein
LVSLTPAPDERPTLTEEQIAVASHAVQSVAQTFKLTPSTELGRLPSVWEEGNGKPLRLLAAFGRDPDRDTRWSSIFVAVYVESDERTFVVPLMVRAWDDMYQTSFTESLEEQLVMTLRSAFPSAVISEERLRDIPVLFRS